MAGEPIGSNTPFAVRLGVAVVALGAAIGVGAWMTSVNTAVSALPKIHEYIKKVDTEGSAYGNNEAKLMKRDVDEIKRDLDALTVAVKEQGLLLREVREAVRK